MAFGGYPYTTDLTVNPLTFRDIDPSRSDRPSEDPEGPERNPVLDNTATIKHNIGEVWCVTLWEARARLIARYGWEVGNQLILQLVTDGMNLAPKDPDFIQARDAILQADMVKTGGANLNELWAAFAVRGMGWGAIAPDRVSLLGVQESFELPPRGNQVWDLPIPVGGAISGSPAVGPDGSIYIGAWDGKVYAINPNTRQWVPGGWPYPLGAALGQFRGSPAVGPDGAIYIGSLDNKLYAINPNGTQKWAPYSTGGPIYSTPAFGADGTIYIGSRDGKLHAVNPASGASLGGLWPVTIGGFVDSSPAIGPDGTIYIGAQNSVHALLPNGQAKNGWPKTSGNTSWSSPAVGRNGSVYATSTDGKLYAWHTNGSAWTSTVEYVCLSSPAIGPEGNIYFGTAGGLRAVNSSGASLWTRATGNYVDSSPAIDAFGNVIVGSWNGNVYAYRPNGDLEWSFPTGTLIHNSSPVLSTNSTVYIGNYAGSLYALSNVTGPARSDWPMFGHNPRHTGNPATLTLASGTRLGDLDFHFEIKGLAGMECTVDTSHNLLSWNTNALPVTLTTGSALFTDVGASGYVNRFYRVRSGSILSFNSLGYVAVNVPPGVTMIANHFNKGNNTLSEVIPTVPIGTTFTKWNDITDQYVVNTFQSGGWSVPGMTLAPGEGGFIGNNTATPFAVTFIGDVPQGHLVNVVPSGLSIRSSIVPQGGGITSFLNFGAVDGDTVRFFDNSTGGYTTFQYQVIGQFQGWDSEPQPNPGQSFWFELPAVPTSRNWIQEFSIWR